MINALGIAHAFFVISMEMPPAVAVIFAIVTEQIDSIEAEKVGEYYCAVTRIAPMRKSFQLDSLLIRHNRRD